MTATTPDILALCAAIDAGDDEALPILADALEEAGHAQTTGMREVIRLGHVPACLDPGQPEAYIGLLSKHDKQKWNVPPYIWGKLTARHGRVQRGSGLCCYPSRSAAYFALAEALSE